MRPASPPPGQHARGRVERGVGRQILGGNAPRPRADGKQQPQRERADFDHVAGVEHGLGDRVAVEVRAVAALKVVDPPAAHRVAAELGVAARDHRVVEPDFGPLDSPDDQQPPRQRHCAKPCRPGR